MGKPTLGAIAFVSIILLGGTPSGAIASPLDPGQDAVAAKRVAGHSRAAEYWTPGRMARAQTIDAPDLDAASYAPILAEPQSGRPMYAGGAAPGVASGGLSAGTISTGAEPQSGRSSQQRRTVNRTEVTSPNHLAFPAITHGKIFGQLSGIGNYVCSGTVIATADAESLEAMVLTAAHCAYDRNAGFAKKLIFVPAYHEGDEPFGRFEATAIKIPRQYKKHRLVTFDLAALKVGRNSSDQKLKEVVGARGISFNQPRDQLIDAYGYPAEGKSEFDGQRMFVCKSVFRGSDRQTAGLRGPETMKIDCDMTGGSSGGGWVIKQSGATVAGFVYSVVSYQYGNKPNSLFGPYFSTAAYKVWIAAQTSCMGQLPTLQGTDGDDLLVGTPDDDVIVAGAGADEIRGLGGSDVICAGQGADTVIGDSGSDILRGEGGNDEVIGGKGHDVCNGGSGHNTKRTCERSKKF